jgi:hypothetical protein
VIDGISTTNIPFVAPFLALVGGITGPNGGISIFGITGTTIDEPGLGPRLMFSDVRYFPMGGADTANPCCTPVAGTRLTGINNTADSSAVGLGSWLVQDSTFAVPSPIAGAGPPGLILCGGLLAWWRKRANRPAA